MDQFSFLSPEIRFFGQFLDFGKIRKKGKLTWMFSTLFVYKFWCKMTSLKDDMYDVRTRNLGGRFISGNFWHFLEGGLMRVLWG